MRFNILPISELVTSLGLSSVVTQATSRKAKRHNEKELLCIIRLASPKNHMAIVPKVKEGNKWIKMNRKHLQQIKVLREKWKVTRCHMEASDAVNWLFAERGFYTCLRKRIS